MAKKNIGTLCDWDKNDRKIDFKLYVELVKNPKFVCMDCGRVAAKKAWLCNPKRIKEKKK
jgi:hypothetical protein